MGLVHWDDPERWYGEGGGRGVQDGEHVYTRATRISLFLDTWNSSDPGFSQVVLEPAPMQET